MFAFVDHCRIPICESCNVRDIILIVRCGERGYRNSIQFNSKHDRENKSTHFSSVEVFKSGSGLIRSYLKALLARYTKFSLEFSSLAACCVVLLAVKYSSLQGEFIYYKETVVNMQITRVGQACHWVG